MPALHHTRLGAAIDTVAPDGSEVRFLLRGERGEVNHFTLPAGAVSAPVAHHTIEEIWYFLSGDGEMWRSDPATGEEAVVAVGPGTALHIATGVRFQFRNTGDAPLRFLIATMPPWPGAEEAYAVEGRWTQGD